MANDERINLLARVAQSPASGSAGAASTNNDGPASSTRSILTLAAAAYGARPTSEATVPTGFDPHAAILFECIVEGAYLVAAADGNVDEEERQLFERIVMVATGGAVSKSHISDLVADLEEQLAEDGMDLRVKRLAEGLVTRKGVSREEHAREVLRIAALVAHVSEDVSPVEREVLEKIAAAFELGAGAVDAALGDVKRALS